MKNLIPRPIPGASTNHKEASRAGLATKIAVLAAVVACVPLAAESGRPCPCVGELECCKPAQICRAPGTCPAPKAGVDAAVEEPGGDADDAGRPDLDAVAMVTDPLGCWSEARVSNVLVLAYDPILASKQSLRKAFYRASDPQLVSVRMAEYVRKASHDLVNYHIIEYREVPAWPKQLPGRTSLDEKTFFNGPSDFSAHDGLGADYGDIFQSQNLCSYVTEHDVSEIWLWGATGYATDFGFGTIAYKFAGDKLPFPNPTVAEQNLYDMDRKRNMPDCGRTLWVLGFDYNHGYDPRLYNVRVAEILSRTLKNGPGIDDESPFSRFSHCAFTFSSNGNDIQVGDPVHPPNGGLGRPTGMEAFDFQNRTVVPSGADDWHRYPNLTGAKTSIDCAAWGCTDDGFQAWYADHLPHVAGGSSRTGCNNWWKYVVDVDARLSSCSGAACRPAYANGRSCNADDQCASQHCSCQGNRMACSETAGASCVLNFDPCLIDKDCLSDVCGCNGGTDKVCLPNLTFPRDCALP